MVRAGQPRSLLPGPSELASRPGFTRVEPGRRVSVRPRPARVDQYVFRLMTMDACSEPREVTRAGLVKLF